MFKQAKAVPVPQTRVGVGSKMTANLESEAFELKPLDETPDTTVIITKPHYCLVYRGLFMSGTAGFFKSSSNVISKKVDLVSSQIVGFSNFTIALFLLPFIIRSLKIFFLDAKSNLILLAHGCACAFSGLSSNESVQRLPISDFTVISFCIPVMIAILARCIIKEPCSLSLVLSLLFTIAGLLLVVKLPSLHLGDWSRVIGVLCGLVQVLLTTATEILKATKLRAFHETVTVFHSASISAIINLGIAYSTGYLKIPTLGESWLLLLRCVMSLILRLLCIMSLRYETAGLVNISQTITSILSAFIFQAGLFHDALDVYSFCGAALVFVGGFMISFKKYLLALPEAHRVRRTMRCFL